MARKTLSTEKALEIAAAREATDPEAAEAIRTLVDARDRFAKLDREAATHVESLICMRTDFTGDPPYVGWKGLGLALKEALDERDRLREALVSKESEASEGFAKLQ